MIRRVGPALFLFLVAMAGPASAFDPQITRSVVSLLPDWPADARRMEEPEASAVAVMEGGYLATNDHVLGVARSARVRLSDGREVPVEIVGRDRASDLALLKAPVDLPVPPMAPPPPLGGRVCAVGNQFGLGLSVTCGVVSAVGRTGTGFNPIEDFIQTDATVNPGGSGGALFDEANRLVGIVSAIFTKRSDGDIGINFAASMRLVMRVVGDIRDTGAVRWGEPGVVVAPLPPERRAAETGVVVRAVTPEGAAEKAGLIAGDVVVAVAGRPIVRPSDFLSGVMLHRPGEAVELVFRRDGEVRRTELIVSP